MTTEEKDSLDHAFELVTTPLEGEGDKHDHFHDLATRSVLRGIGRALIDIAESLRELLDVQKSATDGSKLLENLFTTIGGVVAKRENVPEAVPVEGALDAHQLRICTCLHMFMEHLNGDGPCTADCPCEGFALHERESGR